MKNFLLALLIIGLIFSCSHSSTARAIPNWQNLDLEDDGIFGISTEKAYQQLLQHKKSQTAIVAVIDSGIDTAQEDLKNVLWMNPIDGSHGQNYIVQETGKEDFIPMLLGKTDNAEYRRILKDYHFHVQRLEFFVSQLNESKKILAQIIKNIGNENPSAQDFSMYRYHNDDETKISELVIHRLPWYPDFARLKFCELDSLLGLGQYHLEHGLSIDVNAAKLTPTEISNADISYDPAGLVADPNTAPPGHGTYVAGIIGAMRNNNKGINGIADNVRIMMLKCFSNIREMRNEKLALAIRFAADHGAQIINMSFGKGFSLHREEVDNAVKYAMSKDILIVHSAGNDGMNLDLDSNSFYPSPKYLNGGFASSWITVGASGYTDISTSIPSFSNYGHQAVDVFAPGVEITSTLPHNEYVSWDGTSQAAPVVAGLAALIRSYYPKLSAVQVKEIIMKTVIKRSWLENKCVSGGVVNAYNALKLAQQYK